MELTSFFSTGHVDVPTQQVVTPHADGSAVGGGDVNTMSGVFLNIHQELALTTQQSLFT